MIHSSLLLSLSLCCHYHCRYRYGYYRRWKWSYCPFAPRFICNPSFPVHGEARQLTSSFCVNIHPWYSMQSIYIHYLMHGCTRLCICQFVVKAQLLCVCPSLRAQPIYHSAIHFDMLFTRNAPFDSSFFVNRSVNNIYSITSVKFICIAHLMQAALDAHLSPICSACNLQFTVFSPVIHTLLTQKRAHSLFIHSFYLL